MDPESVNQIVKAIMSLHDGVTWWKPETVVPAGAALIAAGAVIVTNRQAKRQITAANDTAQKQIDSAQRVATEQLIRPMREEWIRELRKKISSHVSACLERAHDPFVPIEAAMDRAREVIRQLVAIKIDILLMLNPKEEDHTALGSALSKLEDVARKVPVNSSLLAEAGEEAMEVAHRILKTEWDRTSSTRR